MADGGSRTLSASAQIEKVIALPRDASRAVGRAEGFALNQGLLGDKPSIGWSYL